MAKQLVLSCPAGTELLQSSVIFGAMNQDLSQLNYCKESKIWENPENNDNTNCTALIDHQFIQTYKNVSNSIVIFPFYTPNNTDITNP